MTAIREQRSQAGPGEARTLLVPVYCRLRKFTTSYPEEPRIQKGWRFDFQLDAHKDVGYFVIEIMKCDKPLASESEGEIVIAVATPAQYFKFFPPGARGTLYRGPMYAIADCEILAGVDEWIYGVTAVPN